jgi:hypothetical protein
MAMQLRRHFEKASAKEKACRSGMFEQGMRRRPVKYDDGESLRLKGSFSPARGSYRCSYKPYATRTQGAIGSTVSRFGFFWRKDSLWSDLSFERGRCLCSALVVLQPGANRNDSRRVDWAISYLPALRLAQLDEMWRRRQIG